MTMSNLVNSSFFPNFVVMKETFQNFRYWLIYNLDCEPNRAEELASRLRTIERKLQPEYGADYIRQFYFRLKKIVGSPQARKDDIDKILKGYKKIFDCVSSKEEPFNGISQNTCDEYKAVLRYYLQFLRVMTGRFTESKVNELYTSERKHDLKGERPDAIPAKIFKSGVFAALRKVRCIFPGKGSKTIELTYDQLHELIEYATEQRMQSKGIYDALDYTSFMIHRTPRECFDWRSILVDYMDVYADDKIVPLINCRWVRLCNDVLIANIDDRETEYRLPVFALSNHKKLSIAYLPTFRGTVFEHLEYMKRFSAMTQNIQGTIQRILPVSMEELTENVIREAVIRETETLKKLADEAYELLREYASNFRVDLIAE